MGGGSCAGAFPGGGGGCAALRDGYACGRLAGGAFHTPHLLHARGADHAQINRCCTARVSGAGGAYATCAALAKAARRMDTAGARGRDGRRGPLHRCAGARRLRRGPLRALCQSLLREAATQFHELLWGAHLRDGAGNRGSKSARGMACFVAWQGAGADHSAMRIACLLDWAGLRRGCAARFSALRRACVSDGTDWAAAAGLLHGIRRRTFARDGKQCL